MAKLKTVTEIATCTKPSWSNRQRAQFHAFNPNGLAAEMQRLCDIIKEVVGDGEVPYCCTDNHYEIELYKMCAQPAVRRDQIWLAMHGMERRIQQARAFIEESKATA